MKKIVILSLSIIGLTMMSFKGNDKKLDSVKVKNNNLAQSYVCCYFGFN